MTKTVRRTSVSKAHLCFAGFASSCRVLFVCRKRYEGRHDAARALLLTEIRHARMLLYRGHPPEESSSLTLQNPVSCFIPQPLRSLSPPSLDSLVALLLGRMYVDHGKPRRHGRERDGRFRPYLLLSPLQHRPHDLVSCSCLSNTAASVRSGSYRCLSRRADCRPLHPPI